jgi:hypothetical protein
MVEITRLPEFNEIGRGNRPETGPMQFGHDWPGIFIRGDNALAYVSIIALVLAELARRNPERGDNLHKHGLYGLGKLLASCKTGNTGWPPIGGRLDVIEDQKNSAEIKEIPGGG